MSDEETFAGLEGRTITGLCFDPTDPRVLWVSHNAPLYPQPVPDFSGKISRLVLRSAGFEATIEDYVVGLPRSAHSHMTNGLTFGPDGMLYVAQGSNTPWAPLANNGTTDRSNYSAQACCGLIPGG